jgi:hypothetical protein
MCDVQVITSFGCLAHDPVILSNFTGKFWGKEIRPGKSGDTVNRGTVNRGFTVIRLSRSPKIHNFRSLENHVKIKLLLGGIHVGRS